MFKNLRIFGLLILYALNPIFFIYTQNLSEVSLTDCINISVIFILVSSVFFLLLTIFLKISKLKALIISIIFIIIFNISEPVWNGYLYNYEDTFLSDYFELSLLILAVFLSIIVLLTKSIIKLKKTIITFEIIITIFFLSNSYKILDYYLHPDSQIKHISISDNTISPQTNIEKKPDIVMILFDSYPRADVLKKVYDYDNNELIQFLKSKQFYCVEESKSNYPSTYLSVSSLFNMQIVNDWTLPEYSKWLEYRNFNKVIQNSKSINYLRYIGYKYSVVSPGPGDIRLTGDYVFETNAQRRLNNFEIVVLNNIMFSFRIWQMRDYYEWYRLKIINQIAIFTDANKLKGIPSPYFLYAHINCPHVPFVVSESGGEIDNKYNTRTLQAQTHKELFLGQVKFINKKIIEIVHNLQSLKEKPVIIIISDHGHAFWNDLNPEDSEYASIPLRNFISVYFPDKNAQDYFYKNMTLVNLFPIIFNAYFNTDIKLSQDISYYYKDFSKYPNSYKIFY